MNKSRQITLGSIITVLSIILIYFTSFLPTMKVFLISLSSFLIAILIIEVGKKSAILSFIATSILGLLLIPNKTVIIPYISFLGFYALVKLYIEKLDKLMLEWVLKLIVFNISLIVNYIIFTKLFISNLNLPLSIGIVFFVLQIVFIIYDFTFSLFVEYYNTRIKKLIR